MIVFNGTPCSFVVNDAKKRRKFSSSPPMTCFCLAEFLEKEWEGQVQVLRGTNEENYKMRIFVAMVKWLGYLLYNRSYPFFLFFLGVKVVSNSYIPVCTNKYAFYTWLPLLVCQFKFPFFFSQKGIPWLWYRSSASSLFNIFLILGFYRNVR